MIHDRNSLQMHQGYLILFSISSRGLWLMGVARPYSLAGWVTQVLPSL